MSVFTNPASSSKEQASEYIVAVLELVGSQDSLDILERTPGAVRNVVAAFRVEHFHQPEASGKWSATRVVQHLADSEIVWGYRLRMVIAHDRPVLTGYDQDMWADRLGYDDADLAEALEVFAVLRAANLRLLRRLSPEDRVRVGVHAERGEESVEHMTRLYAGHDLLHLRQLDRIRQAVAASQ